MRHADFSIRRLFRRAVQLFVLCTRTRRSRWLHTNIIDAMRRIPRYGDAKVQPTLIELRLHQRFDFIRTRVCHTMQLQTAALAKKIMTISALLGLPPCAS